MEPQQGSHGVSERKRSRDMSLVAKGDLEYHEDKVSLPRVAGAGVGTLGLAYTVPRTRLAHSMVASGYRSANPGRRTLSRKATSAQRRLIEMTQPLGPGARDALSRTQAGRAALKLPRGFRNGVGALAAAELVRHSVPVHRDHYRPVVGATMYGQQ